MGGRVIPLHILWFQSCFLGFLGQFEHLVVFFYPPGNMSISKPPFTGSSESHPLQSAKGDVEKSLLYWHPLSTAFQPASPPSPKKSFPSCASLEAKMYAGTKKNLFRNSWSEIICFGNFLGTSLLVIMLQPSKQFIFFNQKHTWMVIEVVMPPNGTILEKTLISTIAITKNYI